MSKLNAGEPELLWTGGEWLEGPAWLPDARAVRFSDIPGNRILQFDASTAAASVYAEGVEFVNGRTVAADGSVVQCSHGLRRVERDAGGIVTPIVERWAGGRFNSPNDVVIATDGSTLFTDPPYGLSPSGREGHPGPQDYEGCFVFRFDGATAEPVITDMAHPNGLALSPDESLLYVADTGITSGPARRGVIRVYDTSTWEGHLFVETTGIADGFRVDADGNLWTSSGNAIEVYSPAAELLLTIPMPELVSNLCFGEGHLYVTASTSLYRVALGESPR